jgi:hypothetical protein
MHEKQSHLSRSSLGRHAALFGGHRNSRHALHLNLIEVRKEAELDAIRARFPLSDELADLHVLRAAGL